MRLIDLHCNWAIQYACESTQYNQALYPQIAGRLSQVDGYLSDVSAAVLVCGRSPADWAGRADPWQTLGEMIARYEAEFSGRMLHGPDDAERWLAETSTGLCWGMIGIGGLDFLIRESSDLDRLAEIFARGARVFQLAATDSNRVAGVHASGDGRGVTALGHALLDRLADLAPPGDEPGACPILDLAGLNERSIGEVLSWFEAAPGRCTRLPLVRSHGGTQDCGLNSENLRRFRVLGGTIGLSLGDPFVSTPEALRETIDAVAAIPINGRSGYEGIAIGTSFLELERSLSGLGNASEIIGWLTDSFPGEVSRAVVHANARQLLLRATGFRTP
jgi:membrane dipeptidase